MEPFQYSALCEIVHLQHFSKEECDGHLMGSPIPPNDGFVLQDLLRVTVAAAESEVAAVWRLRSLWGMSRLTA